MRRRLAAIVLTACGGTGGVTDTPPAPAFTTTTSPSLTIPLVSDATVDSGITEEDVSELESVLDEIEDLITDTEQLLNEPLP